MSITLRCPCGATYNLKDELQGSTLRCPACNRTLTATRSSFDTDKFLVNQKHFSISEKYYVYDEAGNKLFFVERSRMFLRIFLAIIAGLITWGVVGFLSLVLGQAMGGSFDGMFEVLGFLVGFIAMLAMIARLIPYRHVDIWDSDRKTALLVQIQQKYKWVFLHERYDVVVGKELIARLEKNHMEDMFRKKWVVSTAAGVPIMIAKEDSLILSLLRRLIGPLFGLLRTNFVFFDPTGTVPYGEFNRKFTILDKYVLDMTPDTARKVDRRVALALGIILDTGEHR